ncbi:hypothetical protein [Ferrovibrio terrae]|uniref:hypothetical protein n=1 Tax=Ferrovibrio terrae TaxID=2594003 RepID=UPI003137BB70
MLLSRPSIELYFGRGGTGKTCLALSRIGPARSILFDINEQEILARHAVVCTTARELVLALQGNARRICWRGFGTLGPAAFEFGNKAAWAAGDLVVYWDEVDFMMEPSHCPPWAYRLINAGRHHGVTIKATARRPASVSRHLTAGATAVYSYAVTGSRDVVYLADFFGRDAAAALPNLGRGQALIWTEHGTTQKKIY